MKLPSIGMSRCVLRPLSRGPRDVPRDVPWFTPAAFRWASLKQSQDDQRKESPATAGQAMALPHFPQDVGIAERVMHRQEETQQPRFSPPGEIHGGLGRGQS